MASATRWNQRPAYTNAPLLGKEFGTQAALHSAGVYGGVALLAAGASRYGCGGGGGMLCLCCCCAVWQLELLLCMTPPVDATAVPRARQPSAACRC
jgi:hypothetical protein